MDPFPKEGTFFWIKNRECARALDAAFRAVMTVAEDWFRVGSRIRSITCFRFSRDPLPYELQSIQTHFFRIFGRRDEDQFSHVMCTMWEIAKTGWKDWVKNTMQNRL